MLAINLDQLRRRYRGSRVLFIHSIRVRRRLLGASRVDTAAPYNSQANLLRRPAMAELGQRRTPKA